MADTSTEKTAAKAEEAKAETKVVPAEKPQAKAPAEKDTAADTKADEKPADKAAEVTAVPEGHRRVLWVYCASDPSRNGTVEDVDADEAAELVEGNRASYVDAETTAVGPSDRATKPERRSYAPGNAPADTSSGGEAGSPTANAG